MFIASTPSPLGSITIASDGVSLCGLWLEGQNHFASTLDGSETEMPDLPIFEQTRLWLCQYFEGTIPNFTPKLDFRNENVSKGRKLATPFRIKVWETLLTIPYGSTMSYGEIAKNIARSQNKHRLSAQAIGGAVGHNPISIIIPCHRVVGSNGTLTGYAGGIDKKEALLKIEKRQ